MNLDPKIPYSAFHLSMPTSQLNCSKIFGSPVDALRFGQDVTFCYFSRLARCYSEQNESACELQNTPRPRRNDGGNEPALP